MLKGQDVVLLLRLLGESDVGSTRALADELGLDVAGVHRALHRLTEAGLVDQLRRRVPVAAAEEFLVHAVKYVFPAERGGETRGVAAAWAAAPLVDMLAPNSELPPVWPYSRGRVRGIALEPLHPVVPELAADGGLLARRLALVDAIRAGDTRIRTLAEQALREELAGAV